MRFREATPQCLRTVGDSLKEQYFSHEYFADTPHQYLTSKEGQADFANHLEGRLQTDRHRVVPWLNAARPLEGARILEIGCGTGCSTVALAEQGARVTAVDLRSYSLQVASVRCAAYGLNAEFHCLNATQVADRFRRAQFDFIIFFATLEHLLHEERLAAMSTTWNMLPAGALWCVVEAPNRLAMFDYHTSSLPFFDWLPDDLAYRYAKFSPRMTMRSLTQEDGAVPESFLRHGRGVSYHEFELALGPVQSLDVVSCLNCYIVEHNLLSKLLHQLTLEARTERLLRRVGPAIHRAFYQSWLDLIIRKK